MKSKIIFNAAFPIMGVMCYESCGVMLKAIIVNAFNDLQKQSTFLKNTTIKINTEAQPHGMNYYIVTINGETELTEAQKKQLYIYFYTHFKESGFSIYSPSKISSKLNIAISLLTIAIIFTLFFAFPPSLFLSLGLASITFLSTAFAMRQHLFTGVKLLTLKKGDRMNVTIILGWLLCLIHMVYHIVIMPSMLTFSMLSMAFLMPLALITLINVIDLAKEIINYRTSLLQQKRFKEVVSSCADHYRYIEVSKEMEEKLRPKDKIIDEALHVELQALLESNYTTAWCDKYTLKRGLIIEIEAGNAFPVDCILLDDNAIINESLITGKPYAVKQKGQTIQAGVLNLGNKIRVYTCKSPYNSTANQISLRSNRNISPEQSSSSPFTLFYFSITALGIIGSAVLLLGLGIFTWPVLLQMAMGSLFVICPCTLSLGESFPGIISYFTRTQQGIALNPQSIDKTSPIDTIIFDKTGTLTTGKGEVHYCDLEPSILALVYLLEKNYAPYHPIGEAIINYYEKRYPPLSRKPPISEVTIASNGLSALINNQQVHIGNAAYLQQNNIAIPNPSWLNRNDFQGLTPIYIAIDGYQGTLLIHHEINKSITNLLPSLKSKLILLTGDTLEAAEKFNDSIGGVFKKENIHAGKTYQEKEEYFRDLIKEKTPHDIARIAFIGDGGNDILAALRLSENGGTSCSVNKKDVSKGYTDINLDGSLNYLFQHVRLNLKLQHIKYANRGIVTGSAFFSLVALLTFSIMGLSFPPVLPLLVMVLTTFMVIFNSYRAKWDAEFTLNKRKPWFKYWMASPFSIAFLIGAGLSLALGLLLATIASGGLAIPIITFTASLITATYSTFFLTSLICTGVFLLLSSCFFIFDKLYTQNITSSGSDAAFLINPTSSNNLVNLKNKQEERQLPLKEVLYSTRDGRKNSAAENILLSKKKLTQAHAH